jgi:hypothetical protein
MRKRKPIGTQRASKLMHDLGLRTPEEIMRQIGRLEGYGKLSRSPSKIIRGIKGSWVWKTKSKTIGGDDMPVSVDLEHIKETGYRCGACHKPIVTGQGVAFGRPQLMLPAINVCRSCVEVALALMSTGRVVIDVTRE